MKIKILIICITLFIFKNNFAQITAFKQSSNINPIYLSVCKIVNGVEKKLQIGKASMQDVKNMLGTPPNINYYKPEEDETGYTETIETGFWYSDWEGYISGYFPADSMYLVCFSFAGPATCYITFTKGVETLSLKIGDKIPSDKFKSWFKDAYLNKHADNNNTQIRYNIQIDDTDGYFLVIWVGIDTDQIERITVINY